MAISIINTQRGMRAAAHPLFLDQVALELSTRLRGHQIESIYEALAASFAETVECLADADPADLAMTDEEFEERLHGPVPVVVPSAAPSSPSVAAPVAEPVDAPGSPFVRLATVEMMTGRKRSAIYADKTFPQPVKVGGSNRWVRAEIEAWIASRIAERDSRRKK